MKQSKFSGIMKELGEHLPYSIFGAIVGIVFIGVLDFFAVIMHSREVFPQAAEELFHIFHPTHVFLSAAVTTAMFWKHEQSIVRAIIIGFFGSIIICGLSDIIFPYCRAKLFGIDVHLHVCIIESPLLIITFVLIGIAVGFIVPGVIEKSTQYSHSVHVLVSSMASILYLFSYGASIWFNQLIALFITTVVSVIIPCCLSDIIFPLIFVKRKKDCKD